MFSQDSTISFFNKNIISAGLGSDFKIPTKSSGYYFNASPLINFDYSIIVSNEKDYALGFNINAEFAIQLLDYSEHGVVIGLSNGKLIRANIYTHESSPDLLTSVGLNYYRKFYSENFYFCNISLILFDCAFKVNGINYVTVPQTGESETYYYNVSGSASLVFAFNYKMGFIFSLPNYKIIPFIETPLLYFNSVIPPNATLFTRHSDNNNQFPFLEISIGCNIIF